MARFKNIKQISKAHYRADIPWDGLEDNLRRWAKYGNNDLEAMMNPDFQRGHVWTREQQIGFVEFMLRGGESGQNIYWNCPGWMGDFRGPMQLVDGLQRITAILAFLHNEIPAFGHLLNEYEEDWFLRGLYLTFQVGNLPTKAEVPQWYLDLNSGVAHTDQELTRVRQMLADKLGNELAKNHKKLI